MNMDHSEAASGKDKRKAGKKADTGSIAAQVDLSVLTKLLDGVSDGNGAAILVELKQALDDIDPLINRIANSRAIEQRRKLTQTIDTMGSGRIGADFAYAGLPAEAQEMAFKSAYDVHLRPRPHKRADGFAIISDRLDKHPRPLIVETDCLQVSDNWAEGGQSTFQFDWYARERQSSVFAIDINSASIDSARRACSGTISTILNDSRPASSRYLDPFDLDDPMSSAMHHATEMMAARGLVGEGTIICVDDFDVPR